LASGYTAGVLSELSGSIEKKRLRFRRRTRGISYEQR
jgi:hypothetical protein